MAIIMKAWHPAPCSKETEDRNCCRPSAGQKEPFGKFLLLGQFKNMRKLTSAVQEDQSDWIKESAMPPYVQHTGLCIEPAAR